MKNKLSLSFLNIVILSSFLLLTSCKKEESNVTYSSSIKEVSNSFLSESYFSKERLISLTPLSSLKIVNNEVVGVED